MRKGKSKYLKPKQVKRMLEKNIAKGKRNGEITIDTPGINEQHIKDLEKLKRWEERHPKMARQTYYP